jgi:hypothetical protein
LYINFFSYLFYNWEYSDLDLQRRGRIDYFTLTTLGLLYIYKTLAGIKGTSQNNLLCLSSHKSDLPEARGQWYKVDFTTCGYNSAFWSYAIWLQVSHLHDVPVAKLPRSFISLHMASNSQPLEIYKSWLLRKLVIFNPIRDSEAGGCTFKSF